MNFTLHFVGKCHKLNVESTSFFFISQKKEAIGDDDALPDDVTSNILELTKEICEPLTVFQLKKVRSLIDEAMSKNNEVLAELEKHRDGLLREMGNWLHPSVPVGNDEVSLLKSYGMNYINLVIFPKFFLG